MDLVLAYALVFVSIFIYQALVVDRVEIVSSRLVNFDNDASVEVPTKEELRVEQAKQFIPNEVAVVDSYGNLVSTISREDVLHDVPVVYDGDKGRFVVYSSSLAADSGDLSIAA